MLDVFEELPSNVALASVVFMSTDCATPGEKVLPGATSPKLLLQHSFIGDSVFHLHRKMTAVSC